MASGRGRRPPNPRIWLWLAVAILAGCGQSITPSAEVLKTAEDWLVFLDAGDSDAAWDAASPVFRAGVARNEWAEQLDQARGSLGVLRARALSKAVQLEDPPAAPDGTYVVLTYTSTFADKSAAVETVTVRWDETSPGQGEWGGAGYFVR